jgi:hypothetical protein
VSFNIDTIGQGLREPCIKNTLPPLAVLENKDLPYTKVLAQYLFIPRQQLLSGEIGVDRQGNIKKCVEFKLRQLQTVFR